MASDQEARLVIQPQSTIVRILRRGGWIRFGRALVCRPCPVHAENRPDDLVGHTEGGGQRRQTLGRRERTKRKFLFT